MRSQLKSLDKYLLEPKSFLCEHNDAIVTSWGYMYSVPPDFIALQS